MNPAQIPCRRWNDVSAEKFVISEHVDDKGNYHTDTQNLLKVADEYYTKLFTPSKVNHGKQKYLLKNVNKQVAKTVGKSKAFAHLKKQSNNDKKSTGGKKVNKLQKKFSKKSMESKRAKHYNPKNTSHKKNKKT